VGYALASVRGLDLFPMTGHVECVAALTLRTTPGPLRADPGQ
jgi:hypothetical protein